MGTPTFAVEALRSLIEADHDVVCTYAQPPRPARRGQKEQPSPVQAFAETSGIPVRTPLNFREQVDRDAFAALNRGVSSSYRTSAVERLLKDRLERGTPFTLNDKINVRIVEVDGH